MKEDAEGSERREEKRKVIIIRTEKEQAAELCFLILAFDFPLFSGLRFFSFFSFLFFIIASPFRLHLLFSLLVSF